MTDIREHVVEDFGTSKPSIPPLILRGLERYRDERTPVGGFLTAVLENNLSEAVGTADQHSYAALREIVQWVYWEMPAPAWGSKANVVAWLNEEESK